jgi:hypothetical protein
VAFVAEDIEGIIAMSKVIYAVLADAGALFTINPRHGVD